jgi:retron-type reverse transcriptase
VEDVGIAAMLTTPDNIRTLQRKLYCKAKQEPACRFHALYDKVYRADILNHAYSLVRANKGSPGIDGVTFTAIEGKEGADAFIAELAWALKEKKYRPDPVKRVMSITVCTRCPRQRAGRRCMPRGEEHRKAVCGKTACTV